MKPDRVLLCVQGHIIVHQKHSLSADVLDSKNQTSDTQNPAREEDTSWILIPETVDADFVFAKFELSH